MLEEPRDLIYESCLKASRSQFAMRVPYLVDQQTIVSIFEAVSLLPLLEAPVVHLLSYLTLVGREIELPEE